MGKPKLVVLTADDVPTPQRLQKAGLDYEVGDDKRGRLVYTMRDSPLERARKANRIDEHQYGAGIKFRTHWFYAGMAGDIRAIGSDHVSGGYSGLVGAEFTQEHKDHYWSARAELGAGNAEFLERAVCEEVPLETLGYGIGYGNRVQAITGASERMSTLLGLLVAKLGWP